MNHHHDVEWPEIPRRLESRRAYVEIAAVSRDGKPVFEVSGGRHGQPDTYRVTLPGCECERPACKKHTGRIRRYVKPSDGLASDGLGKLGRDGRAWCGCHGYCSGHQGWVPADVLALAKTALKTWGPTR